jgi:hypothetical protein
VFASSDDTASHYPTVRIVTSIPSLFNGLLKLRYGDVIGQCDKLAGLETLQCEQEHLNISVSTKMRTLRSRLEHLDSML